MSATFNILVNFKSIANGIAPSGSLLIDANGDLFGTTENGGGTNSEGTVFEIQNNGTAADPSYATTQTVLGTFIGPDGQSPSLTNLIMGANSYLIGTTQQGGSSFDGTVFEIKNTGTVANPNYPANAIPTVLDIRWRACRNAGFARPIFGGDFCAVGRCERRHLRDRSRDAGPGPEYAGADPCLMVSEPYR
jgi:hypothetical protein